MKKGERSKVLGKHEVEEGTTSRPEERITEPRPPCPRTGKATAPRRRSPPVSLMVWM